VSCSSSQRSSRPAPKWAGIAYTGEGERLLEGTSWNFQNLAANNRTIISVEFRRDGRLVFVETDNSGSWERVGDTIKFVCLGGDLHFEGIYYPENQRILGTFFDSFGGSYNRTLELAGSSTIASTPSSTTNVYVQPSAPAQSPAPAPTPSAPTFQTGTYAWSNSGQNMTMNFVAGIVRTNFNNRQIWYGTYRINGTQLVISVTSAISDYSRLQGMTYSYTITSSTSFSGSGETWVRTGY
jgi:hypothetical protein